MAESRFLGVLATVGEDGTIKIPLDKLETAGIEVGEQVEIFSNGEYVFIRAINQFCDICGINGNMTQIGNLKMCRSCIQALHEKAQQTNAIEVVE
jgi:bifunctional DNA-binding transcriptional regulator/antitoxin component of YhaV-PrlF toxin-antitoxin module